MYIIYSIIIIVMYLLYYFLKRIFFMIFYPISYVFRRKLLSIREAYDFYTDWEEDRNIRSKLKNKNKILLFLWFALDDAPYFSKGKEYYEEKCPSWLKLDFLKSYYWGAIRNNSVNLSRFLSPGREIEEKYIINKSKAKLIIRKFNFFISKLPFFEIWFTKHVKFKIGWKSYGVFSFRLNFHVN